MFDREVHCRRAASAAFQENVGRLGAEAVPHGIDILTACDYHAVGQREHAFTSLSVYVGKYGEYRQSLIQHLLDKKIGHWDIAIRELTGTALKHLTATDLDFMVKTAIPTLMDGLGPDLNTKHGTIVAIGNIVLGISEVAEKGGKTLSDLLGESYQEVIEYTVCLHFTFSDSTTIERIKAILVNLEQNMELRGSIGEILKGAVTSFIHNMSDAHFPCHDSDVVDLWKMILGNKKKS